MTAESFLSQLLNDHHGLEEFDSGEPSLDTWLKEHARRAAQQGTASTHVWVGGTTNNVLAFYSVAPTQVARDVVSSAAAGGNRIIPAYLVGRLALDRSLRGKKLGVQLLLDALEVIVTAASTSGGRLVVVDALNEDADDFYRRNSFAPTKTDGRLVMKVSTVTALFS